MKLHRFVVFADRLRGFDDLEDAVRFARANVPSVVCERVSGADGASTLVEILRHDFLYDDERKEWRIMVA